MKIFEAVTIRDLDAYTITQEPISSIDLMERASRAVVNKLLDELTAASNVAIFCGAGNNGGDGLAVARILKEHGIVSKVWVLSSEKYSQNCKLNLDRWRADNEVIELVEDSVLPDLAQFDVFIDALFGSGLNRPIKGVSGRLIKEINSALGKKICIDIPSGMYCDQLNDIEDIVVKADKIYSFQLPKRSFFM